ncbi:hypothetical protein [Dysgonomonas macrotermitis]|nr:hypothetical protein [Dysgonomonas macrotermitis]
MKTPETIFYNLNSWGRNDILEMIRSTQRDAYNQAIDDVDNLIENHDEEVYIGVVNDILKLKK